MGASNASNHAQKNNILDNVPQNVPQKSDIEIIIDAIRDNPNITREELAEKIGKTIKTVGRILRTNPNIVYIGPSKGDHWEIK